MNWTGKRLSPDTPVACLRWTVMVGVRQDAEDVGQEVFAEAWQIWQCGHVENWTGLLVRLATLRAIDRVRRRKRWWGMVHLQETDRVSRLGPLDDLQGKELADWLRKAIADLPTQQAAVFVLMQVEEMSRDEAAAALAISPEAVSSALYKARQKLQEQFNLIDQEIGNDRQSISRTPGTRTAASYRNHP